MFDHVGLRVRDLAASVKFYSAALDPLGYRLCSHDESGAGFGPDGKPALWLVPHAGALSGAHVAFVAPDRRAVERFHAEGLRQGGQENGAPGLRPDYGPHYYAAFLTDLDGNNVEAVCYG